MNSPVRPWTIRITCLAAIQGVCLAPLPGCDKHRSEETLKQPATTESTTNVITKNRAIEIARNAVSGVKLPGDESISVALTDGRFVVTWKLQHERPFPSADYAAKVTVDAQTGEVLQVLGGP